MNFLNQVLSSVVEFANDIIFYDDEDDEKRTLEKISNYAEITIPRLTDHQFKRHFRMNRTAC